MDVCCNYANGQNFVHTINRPCKRTKLVQIKTYCCAFPISSLKLGKAYYVKQYIVFLRLCPKQDAQSETFGEQLICSWTGCHWKKLALKKVQNSHPPTHLSQERRKIMPSINSLCCLYYLLWFILIWFLSIVLSQSLFRENTSLPSLSCVASNNVPIMFRKIYLSLCLARTQVYPLCHVWLPTMYHVDHYGFQ